MPLCSTEKSPPPPRNRGSIVCRISARYEGQRSTCSIKTTKTKNTYGPCSTICPISFRLITFEIRRIAIRADHSRDHHGCANKYCFSCFSFSATLKSSKFQVVKGIIIAKSAIVNKTTNTSRNIVPSEEKKIRSPAYRRKESFGHLYFYICWIENLRD